MTLSRNWANGGVRRIAMFWHGIGERCIILIARSWLMGWPKVKEERIAKPSPKYLESNISGCNHHWETKLKKENRIANCSSKNERKFCTRIISMPTLGKKISFAVTNQWWRIYKCNEIRYNILLSFSTKRRNLWWALKTQKEQHSIKCFEIRQISHYVKCAKDSYRYLKREVAAAANWSYKSAQFNSASKQ